MHGDDHLGGNAFVCIFISDEQLLLANRTQRLFVIGFTNGGYAGSIYGFIFVWIGTLAVFSTMGELASM